MNEQASAEFLVLRDTMIEGFREVKHAIESNADNRHDQLTIEISKLKDLMRGIDVTKIGLQPSGTNILARFFPSHSNPHLAISTDDFEQEIARLRLENGQIIEENERLLANADLVRSTTGQYQTENERLLEICQTLGAQKMDTEKRSKELRDMILKDVRSSEEPLDTDLGTLFCEIRAKIQTLIHDFYSTTLEHTYEPLHQSDVYKSQKAWIKTWSSDPENIRHARSRALVFDHLQEQIFNRRCFGLRGDLEAQLVEFEDLITKANSVHKDKKSDIAEWRVRTLSLAQRTGLQSSQPQRTADSIYHYLHPLLLPKSKTSSPKELDMQKCKIKAMILEICTKAYALTIKMRQSRSMYQVMGVERGERFNGYDETPSFMPQETPVPRDKVMSSRVSFVIFGALVKVPDGVGSGERHILEKAHVVCQ